MIPLINRDIDTFSVTELEYSLNPSSYLSNVKTSPTWQDLIVIKVIAHTVYSQYVIIFLNNFFYIHTSVRH